MQKMGTYKKIIMFTKVSVNLFVISYMKTNCSFIKKKKKKIKVNVNLAVNKHNPYYCIQKISMIKI